MAAALLAAGAEEPRRILDLPCGHGRVLRVMKRAFPGAAFTACDLERDGVDFCAAEFGATPVYSHVELAQVHFAEPFDLIWCGSLVTHLDARGWLATFQLLVRALRPGGVAVITFHGRWVAYRMQNGLRYGLPGERAEAVLAQYGATGFGYADYAQQSGYGISLSAPAWILSELASWPELRIVGLCERQWDQHQDVLAIQRM
jgi:SAM-dependent methyltransferase